VSRWSDSFDLINIVCLDAGIVLEGREKGLDQDFWIVNLYAPYNDRINFWDNLKYREIC
jgi:hypothetical protein